MNAAQWVRCRPWLRPALRDGGLLLIGEPYWISEPPAEAYAGLGLKPDDFTSLVGTGERLAAAGVDLVEMVLSDQDSWDRYVAGLRMTLLLGISKLIRPDRPTREKLFTYESGVDPSGAGFLQSNIRYYVFALLFVMFDVEAVFIFPWALGLETYDVFGLVEMIVFIVILALGLVYAWRKGVLRWL